jgi:hypothetical protein
VTNFEFQLHPMQRRVVGGDIGFPMSEAKRILRFFAEYSASAPDELYMDCGIVSSAGGGVSAAGFSGVVIHICYSGPMSKAEGIVGAIRKAGTPVFDNIAPVDYVALQKAGDIDDPRAKGSWMKSGFVSEITPAMIDAIIDGFEEHPDRGMAVWWQHAGGAINRVATDATAFPHRYVKHDTLFMMNWAIGVDPAPHVQWLREYFAAIQPYTHGFYTNDVMDESQRVVNRNYQGNYERLAHLKNKYDPTNLFRLNANIVPTV